MTAMGDEGCRAPFQAMRFRRDIEKPEKLNHHVEKPNSGEAEAAEG